MQDTAPNIGLVLPITTEILALEKPRNLVFHQNGAGNYFGFRFSLHIPILHGRLSRNRVLHYFGPLSTVYYIKAHLVQCTWLEFTVTQ